MHYLNVHLPEHNALRSIPRSSILLANCVVEVYVRSEGDTTIRDSVDYLRSLMQDASAFPLARLIVTDWWCARNEGISCPYGAVVFYDAVIPWTDDYSWHLNHTIIKFIPRTDADVAISDAFLQVNQICTELERRLCIGDRGVQEPHCHSVQFGA